MHAICPFCAVGCGLEARWEDDSVVFRGDPKHPVNRGALCARGAAATFETRSRTRLLEPLRRAPGETAWSPIGWDEALDRVTAALLEARTRSWDARRRAAPAIGFFGGATAMNEEVYLAVRLARMLGVLDLDHQGRSCHAATTTALSATLGLAAATHDWDDIAEADWVLIIGANPDEAHPIAARCIHAARARGAVVMVADPRLSRTARGADRHLPLRPGTDVALLSGLIAQVLGRGLEDRDWLRSHSDACWTVPVSADIDPASGRFGGFDPVRRAYDLDAWHSDEGHDLDAPTSVLSALRRHFVRYTATLTADICGLEADDIDAIGQLFAARRRGAVLYSMGVTQQISGVAAVRAAALLQALLGNLTGGGGGLFPMKGHANIQGATDLGGLFGHLPGYLPAPTLDEPDLPGYERRHGPTAAVRLRTLLETWYGDAEAGYGALPLRRPGDNHSMQAALARGDLKVMVLLGQNPLHGSGDPRAVARGLGRLRTMVCIDPFLTESARFWEADPAARTEVIALPAASFAEKPGSRTNACRRVQWQEACSAPSGSARPDAAVLDALYRRLRTSLPAGRWVEATPQTLYREVLGEISRACWLYDGAADALAETPTGWHWPQGRARPVDAVRLWAPLPDGPLPAYYAPFGAHDGQPTHPMLEVAPLADFPLILSTAMNGMEGRRCRPHGSAGPASLEVLATAGVAEPLGLCDGDRVWVETPGTRASAILRVIAGHRDGVVWAPSYWTADADGGAVAPIADPGDPDTLLDDLRLVPCRLRRRG